MSVFDAVTAHRIYAVELSPYDPTPGVDDEVVLYVATQGFATTPDDVPANTYFEPVVKSALSFNRQMFSGSEIGGRSMPNRGDLILFNTGSLDGWSKYLFDGRAVTVKVGLKGWAYSAFETVFVGITGDFSMTRTTLTLPLYDRQDLLDKLIQGTAFAGSGGVEGGDDLKNKPKPVCVGECKNIAPVAVDLTNWVYQVHDGEIEAVDAVYDNGKLLATPANYTVDLSAGTFTLTAAAQGLVTADVKGDKTDGIYVSSAADVIRRLVTKYGDLTDPADLDVAAFATLNTATTAPLGFYAGVADMSLLDVLDQIVDSVGAFYGYTRGGLFTVSRFEAPTGSPTLILDENDVVGKSVKPSVFEAPRWRMRLNYRRSWTVQMPDGLDGAATDDFKAFVTEEFRVAAAENPDIKADGAGKGGHKNASDPEPFTTFLVEQTDADDEASRRLELYGTRRWLVPATFKLKPFQIDLGDVVQFSHPRFELAASKTYVVIALNERAFRNEVSMELWG